MTTTIREIQENIARLAAERGLTVEQLAEKVHVPVSAFTGVRMYVRAIERAARGLGVPINTVFGFGDCQPWCTNHQDDGDSDYCCLVVGEYAEGHSLEIWHDQAGTRISFEPTSGSDTYTLAEARTLVSLLGEAVLTLDQFEAV